jgi:Papain-like cysteine protease AvrRpt2
MARLTRLQFEPSPKVIASLSALVWLGCVGGASMAACIPPPSYNLGVPLHGQLTKMWCWAASGEMCMHYFGRDVPQAVQANDFFNHHDCGNSPTPPACINGGWPQFGKYKFDAKQTTDEQPLPWNTINDQIACKKKPIAFAWHWWGGGGHMMVITGYLTVPTGQAHPQRILTVYNPLPMRQGTVENMPYEFYDKAAGHHRHWRDFYDISRLR